MSKRERAVSRAAPGSDSLNSPQGASVSPWRNRLRSLRAYLRTWTMTSSERRYQQRVLKRLDSGQRLGTLGNQIEDEVNARERADQWLANMVALGLRPEHTCIEYGCGSLWCAEPIIRYLGRGRFVGLDMTDRFYELGRERLQQLVAEKDARFAVISRRSLGDIAKLKPNFVYSHRVIHHVSRSGLQRYVQNLLSLLNEQSTLVIENIRPLKPNGSRKGRKHSMADIQRHVPPQWECRQESFGVVITHRA